MRISDWSSDVCSSDLRFTDWEVDYDNAELSSATAVRGWETMPTFTGPGGRAARDARKAETAASTRVEPTASVEGTWNVGVKSPAGTMPTPLMLEIGRASGRARVCKYVKISMAAVTSNTNKQYNKHTTTNRQTK